MTITIYGVSMKKIVTFCLYESTLFFTKLPFLLLIISPILAIGYYNRANDFEKSLKTVCSSHELIMEALDHSPYLPLLDTSNLTLKDYETKEGKVRWAVLSSKMDIRSNCDNLVLDDN